MFDYNITQGFRIETPKYNSAENNSTLRTTVQNTVTTTQNYKLALEHDENSTPLTPEQIAAKQAARQKSLEDIEKAKRANKTITETDKTENGTYTIQTKYDALGNEEKRIVKREDGSICNVNEFKNGIISKTQTFFPGGAIAGDIEYNNQGKPLKERNYSANPNEPGKIESTLEYEYYENGNLKSKRSVGGLIEKEELYYENGSPKYKKNNSQYEEYNDKGQVIKSGFINRTTGEDRKTTLYEYDFAGRVIKETYTVAEGELGESGTTEISYEGNVTKSVYKNSEGAVNQIMTEEKLANGSKKFCIYSPNGILRTEQINSFDETTGLASSKTTIYDKDGQKIGYTTSIDVEAAEEGETYIDTETKYYNSKGESISEEEYDNLRSEKRDDFKY